MEGLALGLDLGTTQSSAVIIHPDQHWVRVADPVTGHWSIPSAVFRKGEGDYLVGQAAVQRGLLQPGRFVSYFKRDLAEAPGQPLTLGGERLLPGRLAEIVFSFLRTEAGVPADRPWAAVEACVPASWERGLRNEIRDALLRVGFPEHRVHITEEPVAAAHFALSEHPAHRGDLVLLYDLGGGTFDAALIEIVEHGDRKVRGHAGLPDCGGMDIDRMIVRRLEDQLKNSATDPDERSSAERELRLAELARTGKHQLSVETGWEGTFFDGTADIRLSLERAELENFVRPVLQETLDTCDELLGRHGRSPDDLARIVTVGGMARMPLVTAMLAQHYGRPVSMATDPELAIAQGAAMIAANRANATAAAAPGTQTPEPQPAGRSLPELVPGPAAATDGRFVHAAFFLAEMLWENDRGGEAAQWYELAAKAGHSRAAYQLAWLRRYAHDDGAAARLWEEAARAGDDEAAYHLGELLWQLGDEHRAERWFGQAALAGHARAAYQLGWIFHRRGDEASARYFWLRAKDGKDKDAAIQLRKLDGLPVPAARKGRP
jgi:actin-like ATPase involved in cell morphogenesis